MNYRKQVSLSILLVIGGTLLGLSSILISASTKNNSLLLLVVPAVFIMIIGMAMFTAWAISDESNKKELVK